MTPVGAADAERASRPRVVVLANSIDELGGAQRVVHLISQGLAERGYPVELVGIAPADRPHRYVDRPAYRTTTLMTHPWPAPPGRANAVHRLRPTYRRTVATRARASAAATAALRSHLADGPPGVLIVAQLWAMEHVPAGTLDRWPVVAQYHSSYEAAAAGRDLARVRSVYRDADVFALLTDVDAEAFRRAGLNNTAVIANPLAVWPPAPVDATAGRTVTYLGRLSAEKGPRFLVDAWGLIADRHPGWRLRIVGSGPDEAVVRRRIEGLSAGADRVDLVPPVADVAGELGSAGVFALPSLTEGLPMALAEAMAMGVACVAADCSAGVRRLAGEGDAARLVPRGDAPALARALDALLVDPDERARLGAVGRASVAPMRQQIVLDRWEDVIAAALR